MDVHLPVISCKWKFLLNSVDTEPGGTLSPEKTQFPKRQPLHKFCHAIWVKLELMKNLGSIGKSIQLQVRG